MQKQIPKLVLLVALLVTFVVSSAPAFGSRVCQCFSIGCGFGTKCRLEGCHFDNNSSQCVNTSCNGICQAF